VNIHKNENDRIIKVAHNRNDKHVRSLNYNYDYNYKTGFFARWGRTQDDDPQIAPFPEILDLEITTKCSGPGGKVCDFCYKSNTPNGWNMPFETFTRIIDMMKPTSKRVGITQVALGADASGLANPDMLEMMTYARINNVIPNITIADISGEMAFKLAQVCGAVAVSRYENKNYCYNSVEHLILTGMKQVNIHQMISKETLDQAYETIYDFSNLDEGDNSRLKGLNAIVFLSLKQKGRGIGFTPLNQNDFKDLIDKAFELNVPIGFDSCGANSFLTAIEGREDEAKLKTYAEPCESTIFSAYIDVHGQFFPCSFTPGWNGWDEGIDVLKYDDFNEVWWHPKVNEFRKTLLKCSRNCPMYKIR
jgi:hypothetical protein